MFRVKKAQSSQFYCCSGSSTPATYDMARHSEGSASLFAYWSWGSVRAVAPVTAGAKWRSARLYVALRRCSAWTGRLAAKGSMLNWDPLAVLHASARSARRTHARV